MRPERVGSDTESGVGPDFLDWARVCTEHAADADSDKSRAECNNNGELGDESLWTEVVDSDETVTEVVVRAAADRSWHLLVEIFTLASKDSCQEILVNCLAASEDKLHHFVDELFDFVNTQDVFSLTPVASLLGCILKSNVVPRNVKETIAKETIVRSVGSARHHDESLPENEVYFLFQNCKDSLKKVDETQQAELIKVLQAEKHDTCRLFGLLWASSLHRWDLAGPLETHSLFRGEPALAVFKESLCSNAFHYAGWVLQNVLSSASPGPVKGRDPVLQMGGLVVDMVFRSMQFGRYGELPKLLEQCRKSELYGAGAMVALWARDLNETRKMALCEKDENAVMRIVQELMDRSLWGVVLRLVKSLRQDPQQELLKTVLMRAAKGCLQPAPRYVLEKLMGSCRDKTFLARGVLSWILYYTNSRLFCKLVAKDLIDLSDTVLFGGPLITLVVGFVASHTTEQSLFTANARRGAYVLMLRKCIEAGLSTQLPLTLTSSDSNSSLSGQPEWDIETRILGGSPLLAAAMTGDLKLVKLLYKTGGTSNAELHQLTLETGLKASLGLRASLVQDFLL
nr:hypothetical protein BaRGS_017514 [Batillaria attramentaria]